MSKYKEVREHVSRTVEEEKRVEEAKSKAMSKEKFLSSIKKPKIY